MLCNVLSCNPFAHSRHAVFPEAVLYRSRHAKTGFKRTVMSDGERAAGTRITSTWFVYPVLWARFIGAVQVVASHNPRVSTNKRPCLLVDLVFWHAMVAAKFSSTIFSFLLCRFRRTPEALAQRSDQLVCVIFSMRIGVTMGKNGCTARDRDNRSPTIASCFTEFDARESRSLGIIGAEVRMHLWNLQKQGIFSRMWQPTA